MEEEGGGGGVSSSVVRKFRELVPDHGRGRTEEQQGLKSALEGSRVSFGADQHRKSKIHPACRPISAPHRNTEPRSGGPASRPAPLILSRAFYCPWRPSTPTRAPYPRPEKPPRASCPLPSSPPRPRRHPPSRSFAPTEGEGILGKGRKSATLSGLLVNISSCSTDFARVRSNMCTFVFVFASIRIYIFIYRCGKEGRKEGTAIGFEFEIHLRD